MIQTSAPTFDTINSDDFYLLPLLAGIRKSMNLTTFLYQIRHPLVKENMQLPVWTRMAITPDFFK
jgi:hypothetical protein